MFVYVDICNVLNRHVSRTRPPPECFQRARKARRAGSVTTGVPPKVRAVEPALRSCEHNHRQPYYSTQTLDKTADVNTPTSPGCDHSLLLAVSVEPCEMLNHPNMQFLGWAGVEIAKRVLFKQTLEPKWPRRPGSHNPPYGRITVMQRVPGYRVPGYPVPFALP